MAREASVLLACLVFAAAAGGDETRAHRSFTMVYETSLKDVPAGAKQARLWVPVPQDTGDQEITNVQVALTAGGETLTRSLADLPKLDAVGGTSVKCTVAAIEHGWGRSLCVETPGKPIALRLSFDCRRYEARGGEGATDEELEMALGPDTLIPLGKKVSAVAGEIEEGEDELETGKRLYDHTLERMRYDKPADSGWGRGDSEWACDSRHGNCTDFHSYFIGLSRSKGIPARFVMGFPVSGGPERVAEVGGYHCWAYFWTDDGGWIPVDISEADKHPEKTEYFFGTLDYDRVTMTSGRDLTLDPAPAQGPLNFLVYPYAEVDGMAWPRVEKSFKRILAD